MNALHDFEQLLRAYTRKRRTPSIPLAVLLRSIGKWSEEIRRNKSDFTDFSHYTPSMLGELIEQAEKKGLCKQQHDEGGKQLIYLNYYFFLVKKAYEEMESDNERLFPGGESLGVDFPAEVLQSIDVKAQFVDLLRGELSVEKPLLKLNFPEGVRSVLVHSEILKERLLDLSISKMRQYLTIKKNIDYIINRLAAAFPGKERSLKDMMNNILTQRNTALAIVKDPDDFTFQVWSNFMRVIMNDFREKETKLEREHSFCQAAYLIGMYNLYYKGRKRSKQEREKALAIVENGIRNTPFFHSFSDIAAFRDPKGFPVSRTVKQKELAAYLEKRTAPHPEGPLPEVIRLRDAAGHEYYIAKEKLLQLCLKKTVEAGRLIRNEVARHWALHLGEFRKIPEMNRREALEADLWRRVKNHDPLLFALLKFELLLMTLQETKPSREVYEETERLFDSKRSGLIPIDEILRFDRKSIMTEARTMIPIWKSIPLIGRLGVFLIRLFKGLGSKAADIKDPSEFYSRISGGEKRKRRSPAGFKTIVREEEQLSAPVSPSGGGDTALSKKQQLQKYRNAVQSLKEEYIGQGDLDQNMDHLVELWNPLVDEEAKNNLIEDVNSMVRDFLRRLKRGFALSPPDAERLSALADQVAHTDALEEIKRKEPLTRYIELFMIKQLEKK